MQELFDKVLFGILATLISTYVLYNYNIYSKAFESVQVQSHPYSSGANKLFTTIVDDLTKLTANIKVEHLQAKSPLSKERMEELVRLGSEVRFRANLLDDRMPDSSKLATQIADKLREGASTFSTTVNFTKEHIDAFNEDIGKQKTLFMKKYFEEIGGVLSKELGDFEGSFNSKLPWQAKPTTLLYVGLGAIIVYIAFLLFAKLASRHRPISDEDIEDMIAKIKSAELAYAEFLKRMIDAKRRQAAALAEGETARPGGGAPTE